MNTPYHLECTLTLNIRFLRYARFTVQPLTGNSLIVHENMFLGDKFSLPSPSNTSPPVWSNGTKSALNSNLYLLFTERSLIGRTVCAAVPRLLCGFQAASSSRRTGSIKNSVIPGSSWSPTTTHLGLCCRFLIWLHPHTRRGGNRSGEARKPLTWRTLFSCTSPCSVCFPPVAALGRDLGVESAELANDGRSWCRRQKWREERQHHH